MGSLAGEIQNPGRNYPIVIGILIPTTVLYAAYPLMVALSLNDDRGVYTAGYFQTSATELTGPWLGIGFVVGRVRLPLAPDGGAVVHHVP